MNITLQQYNTVITGIRAELEIHQQRERELLDINKSLLEQEGKSHNDAETCRLIAIGAISGTAGTPATTEVLKLRITHDAAMASLSALQADVAALEAQIASLKRKGWKPRRTSLGDKLRLLQMKKAMR